LQRIVEELMTTGQVDTQRTERHSHKPWLIAATIVGFVLLGLIVRTARYGAVSPRIRNPNATGGPYPLSEPLFGYQHWIVTVEIFSYLALIGIIGLVVVLWRRYPKHPYLLMTLAITTLTWLDPIMNWATFAAYNPDLWHWPEDWPLVSVSPTIEPLFIAAIAMFVVPPFFPAIWALRRLQARRSPDAFVWLHPLVSLSGFVFVFGFVHDFAMEALCVRMGLYTFTHVIPFGSIFTGTRWQFPLLWQSSLINILMIPAAVMIYRDDSGRTVAEKLARRADIFVRRPALGSFVVMLVVVNLAFMVYGLTYTAITRWSGAATSVVCPWPWPSAKIYDPQGFYEQSGQSGPYSEGKWSTWMNAQPDGRARGVVVAQHHRCGPGSRI
jgi:Spirocyclase AveC-like